MIIPRTCTDISAGDAKQHQDETHRPLEDFRDLPAYVLLGDPGAGKTTAFEAECKSLGDEAYPITADEFLTYKESDLPSEWRQKTIFIDGLDEIRISAQGASEFREIRRLLRALGKPRFRLSCRQADWLGANDQERLESVSPDCKVKILRLNPLKDFEVEAILGARSDVSDPRAFVTTAQAKGVHGLLFNPLSLKMLAEAVGGSASWPESRRETFEIACARMVREHRKPLTAMAPIHSPTFEQLLEAAGHLCTVCLLAGKAGYTRHGQPDRSYPALDSCGYEFPDRLRMALASRLFEGVSGNRSAPVHRQIAEFLAARYLSRIMRQGPGQLPAKRVVALMTGRNGTIVQNMRGLSAWLATLCEDSRAELIRRDPIGVGLYGDISGFTLEDKHEILRQLELEGSWIDPWVDPRDDFRMDPFADRASAFGELAAPELEPAFKEILENDRRDQDHEAFTDFVLRVLRHGTPMSGLSGVLLEIVRDDTRWPRINTSALRAFMNNCTDGRRRMEELRQLFDAIQADQVSDSDGTLLGMLLLELYPGKATPAEVWDCFSKQENSQPIGRVSWLWDIVDKSSDGEVAELLDLLHQRATMLQPVLNLHRMRHLAAKLLSRGLRAYGDQLDTARLYDWLGACELGIGNTQAARDVASWLQERPELQKALILEGLDRCPDSDDFRSAASDVYKRMRYAEFPPDFGSWCLCQAAAKAGMQPRVARHLFVEAFRRRDDKRLTLDILREHADRDERLKAAFDQLVATQARIEKEDLKHREWQRTFTQEQRENEEIWLAHLRSQEEELRGNRADPALLFQLAQLYFRGKFNDDRATVVWETLRAEQHLTGAILQAFRATVNRLNVPGFEEILSLRAKNCAHHLGLPFLAGLAEMDRTGSVDPSRWEDNRIKKAIAFYYTYGALLSDGQPQWYQRLLQTRPETVAKVQVRYGTAELRSGHEHVAKLWELAHDWEHAQVAKHASLPLLRAFPTRCKLEQLGSLDELLWAAIFRADKTSLRELIEKKRSRASMNDTQRVHWLAAGFALEPKTYQDELNCFVEGREKRVRHLAQFFCQNQVPSSWFEELGTAGLECFIRLVGRYVGPELMHEQGWGTPVTQASHLIYDLIQGGLARSPEQEASKALDSLIEDTGVARWHGILSRSQDTQRVIRRDAEFRHPTIEQVYQTLKDGTPANAGDLAALMMDRLDKIAGQISTNNANYWRPYWNEDPKTQKPTDPKHENSCRDAMVHDLRLFFPNAEPEVQYADSKRADMRVAYENFHVPVEIKKNSHRNLWSALRNQLIERYTNRAPETDGYGIYLVFWFGRDYTQAPPSGKRPRSAAELEERLKEEAMLSPEESRKISVCVIDVSKS